MPWWRPPLSLSLPPFSLVYQHPPMCATGAPHQPLNLNLPALPVYKYSPDHASNSWLSETLRVAAEHPLRLTPPSFLFFQKTSHTTHPTRFFFSPPHPRLIHFLSISDCGCSFAASCMHFSSPKMVCETKIVADEHDAIPGSKKESMMWSSPPSSAALNPAEAKDARRDGVFIREFERGDQEEVRRIFYEGIMERIPNTAFRGLGQQPRTQFLYAFLTGK